MKHKRITVTTSNPNNNLNQDIRKFELLVLMLAPLVCNGVVVTSPTNLTAVFTTKIKCDIHLRKLSSCWENLISANVLGRKSLLLFHTLTVKGNVQSGALISCIFHADYSLVKHTRRAKASTVNSQFARFTDRNVAKTEKASLKFPQPATSGHKHLQVEEPMRPSQVSLLRQT